MMLPKLPQELQTQMEFMAEVFTSVLKAEEAKPKPVRNRFTPPTGFSEKFSTIVKTALSSESDDTARARSTTAVGALSDSEQELFIRALNVLFNLWNTTEKVEIINRVNHKRSKNQAVPFSIKDALQQYDSWDDVKRVLSATLFELVTTSHPTEFRNKEMLNHLAVLAEFLHRMRSYDDSEDLISLITDRLSIIWNTEELRDLRPTVEEEKERDLEIFRRSLFAALPDVCIYLEDALCQAFPENRGDIVATVTQRAFVAFRSWSGGGDRDGNPEVTATTTRWGAQRHWEEAVSLHTEVIDALLPLCTPVIEDPALASSIAGDLREILGIQEAASLAEMQGIYRRVLTEIGLGDVNADRLLQAKLYCMRYKLLLFKKLAFDNTGAKAPYSINEFRADFAAFENAAAAAGLANLHVVQKLIHRWRYQITIFGLHLATLDVRQNTKVTRRVVGEVLEICGITSRKAFSECTEDEKRIFIEKACAIPTKSVQQFKTLSAEAQEFFNTLAVVKAADAYAPELFRPFILSLTSSVSDLLGIVFLFRCAGVSLDIVPLTETIPDLANIENLFRTFVTHPVYAEYLEKRHRFQQWMIGPSDSNKDGGVVSATVSLHRAQETLASLGKEYGIDIQIFMGIGSSAARGGSTLEDVIMSAPGVCASAKRALTLQGERKWVFHFPALVRHELDKAIGALLIHAKKGRDLAASDAVFLETLGKVGEVQYRALIQDPEYWRFFTTMTPIWGLAYSTFCQRPLCREGTELAFDDLRAIPHVAANAQIRTNLSAIYSAGAALTSGKAAERGLETMSRMYIEYPFFKNFIDTLSFELSKARFPVAYMYGASSVVAKLEEDAGKLGDLINEIRGPTQLSREKKLASLAQYRSRITDIINIVQAKVNRECNSRSEGIVQASTIPRVFFRTILAQTAGIQQVG